MSNCIPGALSIFRILSIVYSVYIPCCIGCTKEHV